MSTADHRQHSIKVFFLQLVIFAINNANPQLRAFFATIQTLTVKLSSSEKLFLEVSTLLD